MNDIKMTTQLDQMYSDMETGELQEELREYRTQINRDFQAADSFALVDRKDLAEPRRAAAIAMTRRAKRIQKILEERKKN